MSEKQAIPAVITEPAGPALSPYDVADRLNAIADTYDGPDGTEVAVVGGFGKVIVEHGHLELHDGAGEHRRVRRYAKVDAPRRLVVAIGTVGVLTIDALRWCAKVGCPVVVLGSDGAVLAGGPPGRDDARLLRAQALALYSPSGLEIVRYLLAAKLRGQARVAGLRLGDDDTAALLGDMADDVEGADSIDTARLVEAQAANAYWACWERSAVVTFARREVPRLPGQHWSRFNGRRSSVNPGSSRSATDPAGAALNYAYKLAEVESTLAVRRIGLSESVGILHADLAGRPSFACDVMEVVRPLVDEHVLDILAGPLRKRTFVEDSRGVVRCMAPLTHRMAEAMPAYAHALGPVVEHVASLLAAASPYDVKVPSILSGAKHKAAARRRVAAETERAATIDRTSSRGPGIPGLAPRGRPRRKRVSTHPLPALLCRGCGAALPIDSDRSRSRRGWCDRCIGDRRGELGAGMQSASIAHAEAFAEMTGSRPTHTSEASAARSTANARHRAELAAWERDQATETVTDSRWYAEQIAPKLAALTLPAIARATGASTSAASKWRAGRNVPHPRHWRQLAALVGLKQGGR